MHIVSIIALLTSLLAIKATCTPKHHNCLNPSQTHSLVQSWLQLRSLSPSLPGFIPLLNKTLTSEATFEDETISYFIPPGGTNSTGPFARSRAEYLQSRVNGEAVSTTTTPLFEVQVDQGRRLWQGFCDGFVVRWVSSAKVKVEIP